LILELENKANVAASEVLTLRESAIVLLPSQPKVDCVYRFLC